jgi:integrase
MAREKPPVGPVAGSIVEETLPHLTPAIADILRLLRLTACRVGEILVMTLDRLDRTDAQCCVYTPPRHKTSRCGKSRTIHFGPLAIEVLSPHVAASNGRVFEYQRTTISQTVGQACKAHESPRWHPHQLRHTAATEIRAKFGLEAAQAVLGHAQAIARSDHRVTTLTKRRSSSPTMTGQGKRCESYRTKCPNNPGRYSGGAQRGVAHFCSRSVTIFTPEVPAVPR